MDLHIVLVALAALVGGGLVWLIATSATSPGVRRSTLALAIIQVALFYAATSDLLGRPKPVEIELLSSRLERSEVLAQHLRQDEAIFLWLRAKTGGDPIAYRLPWSEQTARQLYEAGQQVEQQGGSVELTMQGEDGTEGGEGGDPTVGWVPPTAPPPKPQR
ncbi:hypothetical protein [Thalassobaculum sp.]|uniref:hypothetical protein n=1 Tax=Thalassobaculum sp. TaxID=2022740 RepID=UPI0032EC4EC8